MIIRSIHRIRLNSLVFVSKFESVTFRRGVKKIFIVLLLAFIRQTCWAQSTTPKYSNEFLSIGIDARALGLSGAYTAISNDASSGYWNPAGLNSLTTQYDFGLMHAQYFAGIANYDYIGFATQIDSVSTLGVSVIRFGIDDIPDTRFLYDANGAVNYDNIQFFSAADYAFLLSYARTLSILGGIDIGGNVKIVHRSAGSFAKAWGFGLDIGVKKQIGNLNLGLMLRDITGTYNSWSHNTSLVADIYTQTGNVIPENSLEVTLPKAVLGVSYLVTIKKVVSLLASVDLEFTMDGQRNTLISSDPVSIDPRMGIEIGYLDKFFLRGGVGYFQEVQNFDRSYSTVYQPNFGLGFDINHIRIDYALTDIGDQAESPYSHVVSLKFGLDGKE